MTLNPSLVAAFLKCPTKCWLRATGETPSGNLYAEWAQTQNESYRATLTENLRTGLPPEAFARSPAPEKLRASQWLLAVEVAARTPETPRSSRREEAPSKNAESNQSLVTSAATASDSALRAPHFAFDSCLHAVERVPAEGRGKAVQFIPIRFISFNKLTKDDKLLLAFDAFVLGQALGRDSAVGKLIHGDDHATLKVKTSALASEVRKQLAKMAKLLSSPTPPDLVLNRHCGQCEFQSRCRQKALETDDLSLLGGMNAKERQKLRSKGIFTVTQLSYTFRPRRRPKRQLVCDFYAGYDGVECPKQRCLIHLLRDLNDELYKHPYDEELKRLGQAFADLVKPMVETVDRHGLKAHFLKKHLSSVDQFYRELSQLNSISEASRTFRQRFERNREELFTFLRYDGVPWNNNNAEHAVKPFAMLRRVIDGVTSKRGVHDYLILLSVCETCKYMGVDFLDFLRSGEQDIHAFAESRRRRRSPTREPQAPPADAAAEP